MSEQVFHPFMINDLLDPKIWPSKAQTSVKNYYLKTFQSCKLSESHSGTTFRVIAVATASIYMLLHFGYFLEIPSTVLRNPLPRCSLADACISVLAGFFHFMLPHSCCPFFFAKVRLTPSHASLMQDLPMMQ